MQNIRNLKKRSGFTLVELLIVIIIIGILAGAMMMLAGSGSDRAEATKIISDLRGLKAAALMYYADNGGGTVPEVYHATSDDLAKYMDRDLSNTNYLCEGSDSDTRWYVGIAVSNTGVRSALARSAQESGLLGDGATPSDTLGDATTDVFDNDNGGHTHVWMRAR